jgi:homoserine dehydrogenase
MKTFFILLFSTISVYSIGQTTEFKVDTSSILAKISSFDVKQAKVNIEKTHTIPELSFKDAETSADSAALANSFVEVKEKFVRFDKEIIAKQFPEVTTIDHLNNTIVDYNSFIPILMQLVSEQQKLIEELNQRITELEASKK